MHVTVSDGECKESECMECMVDSKVCSVASSSGTNFLRTPGTGVMGSIFMTRAETRGLPPVARRGDKYGEAVLNKSWTGVMPLAAKYRCTRLGVTGTATTE